MKRIGLILSVLVALVGCQIAVAKQAHAEPVTRVLVKSGLPNVRDFSPEGVPRLGDTVEVPAGKTLEMGRSMEAGKVIVRAGGNVTRSSPIFTNGDTIFEGHIDWVGQLEVVGLDHLSPGPNVLTSVEGAKSTVIELEEPLTTRYFAWSGYLATSGHPVHVLGLAYPLQGSTTRYEASRLEAGEYLTYPLKSTPLGVDTIQESAEAEIIVRGQAHSTFKGEGWCYKAVALEAGETLLSSSSYMVEGAWADNTPALTVERGTTVTVEGDTAPGEVVIGPAAQTIASSEAGRPYTLALPYPMEATTTATVSDMHVTGGPLTLHGATDGGGNEGVVFTP